MGFQTDTDYARKIGRGYGKYRSTFHSQNGQVLALLFEQGGELVAHVSFEQGLKPHEVTDRYYTELKEYAAEQGFDGNFRLIYAE